MGLLALLLHNPLMFLLLVIPLLYSIILHEIAHGWVAYLFGDPTAKYSGRLSLNPLIHLDLLGTIALFLVGFGWAKPVPVNYGNLKRFRPALVCVSLAGCLANLIVATIALLLMQLFHVGTDSILGVILLIVAKINIILGCFNLIPIPPLDGSKVLMGFLPPDLQRSFSRIEPYGFYILFFLLITGLLTPLLIFFQKVLIGFISGLISIIT